MTLAEIREWYEANKIHTMYEGHWCRTCSIGFLLHQIDAHVRESILSGKPLFAGEPGPEYPPPTSKPFSIKTIHTKYNNAFNKGDDE